jgi:hypothetical protein
MNKYIKPAIEVLVIETQQMIAESIIIDNGESVNPGNADSREFHDLDDFLDEW